MTVIAGSNQRVTANPRGVTNVTDAVTSFPDARIFFPDAIIFEPESFKTFRDAGTFEPESLAIDLNRKCENREARKTFVKPLTLEHHAKTTNLGWAI